MSKIGILRIGVTDMSNKLLNTINEFKNDGNEVIVLTIKNIEEDERNREINENMRAALETLLQKCDYVGTYADIFMDLKKHIDNNVLKIKYPEKFIDISGV